MLLEGQVASEATASAGTIEVQATIVNDNVRIAVVGGTGAYADARGIVRTREVRGGTIDTIQLFAR